MFLKRCSWKFSKIHRKNLCRSLFFNKVSDCSAATLFKKDSSTGGFLWILRNFQKHLFDRKALEHYFCKWHSRTLWHFWQNSLWKVSFKPDSDIIWSFVMGSAFNCSYVFAKISTKSHCFTQSDWYLVGFHIFLNNVLQDFEEVETNVFKTSLSLSLRSV